MRFQLRPQKAFLPNIILMTLTFCLIISTTFMFFSRADSSQKMPKNMNLLLPRTAFSDFWPLYLLKPMPGSVDLGFEWFQHDPKANIRGYNFYADNEVQINYLGGQNPSRMLKTLILQFWHITANLKRNTHWWQFGLSPNYNHSWLKIEPSDVWIIWRKKFLVPQLSHMLKFLMTLTVCLKISTTFMFFSRADSFQKMLKNLNLLLQRTAFSDFWPLYLLTPIPRAVDLGFDLILWTNSRGGIRPWPRWRYLGRDEVYGGW